MHIFFLISIFSQMLSEHNFVSSVLKWWLLIFFFSLFRQV